jgi:hypothetical protein
MSTPTKKHCHQAPACTISPADAPAPPGIDPAGWKGIGTVGACSCTCSICRPKRRGKQKQGKP